MQRKLRRARSGGDILSEASEKAGFARPTIDELQISSAVDAHAEPERHFLNDQSEPCIGGAPLARRRMRAVGEFQLRAMARAICSN